MLTSVPFYGALVGKELAKVKDKNKQIHATQSHVLVYGAVVAHSKGPMGCTASNATIGQEAGISADRARNVMSELNKAGWVEVKLRGRKRVGIKPTKLAESMTSPNSLATSRAQDTSHPASGISMPLARDAKYPAGGNKEDRRITVQRDFAYLTDKEKLFA